MRDHDEVRDLLPELLHGRLSPADAAAVRVALASDASLAAEYAMLQAVRPALTTEPRLDLAAIVAALPAPPAAIDDFTRRRLAKAAPLPASRAIPLRFARAAAVLAVLAGGSLFVAKNRANRAALTVGDTAVVVADAVQLGLGAAVDDLSEEQLQALEQEISELDGLPSADPEVGLEEGA
jgi:anti-sigma factor RsiW